ncbi:ABC transporter substrate-binding protein [Limnohabitans sp. TS-CS-82]|uniref:ABC transporter substrate-binding protein n=1 Tax=Limnohabitans sp. TS-CS-82 TaxID=2094193 RepID=UPI000CF247CE|nr:helical backbone metal receptor [Limnohabitans sp. TS-CS-82]PQA82358.1 ABC transporter substrate-binding protein [Limnohabitans sp. TS-CS-82]
MLKGILALATLFIMTSTAHAVVLRDDRQIEVTIAKTPQRIVSLLPSLTETVCALGQCDKLVGVDRYSNWPESIAKLPRMGGGIDPNIESVVAAKPDLVLMATSARGAERLTSLGLTVLAFEPRSHADVQRVMRIVAQAMDVPLVESDRVWRHIDAAVNAAAQSIPAQAKGQRVYFEVSRAPYGASESSFIGETLQRLGARNILPASLGPFPKINPEFVVRAQPDLIMVGDSNFADMTTRPGWQNMRAMRTQRVCHFKAEESDMLVRAGPRMAEAARLMAKCMTEKADTSKANDKPKGQP